MERPHIHPDVTAYLRRLVVAIRHDEAVARGPGPKITEQLKLVAQWKVRPSSHGVG